jgi:hypothetical protein
MALPYRVRDAVVGVILETTPYTFLEPGNAQSFPAMNITVSPSQEIEDRNDGRPHFGRLDAIPGGAEVEIGFEIYLVGASAAGTVPYWDIPMLASGHSKTVVASTSVTYKPTTRFDAGVVSTTTYPGEVYSVAVWEGNGGPRYGLRGGQGNVKLVSKQGIPAKLQFNFKGAFEAVVDDATPPTITASTLAPPQFLSAGISVHGVSTLAFDGIEFDKGNELSRRADSNSSAGIRGAWITKHNPSIKIDPELVAVATLDILGKWRSGATGAFTTGVIGSTAGNRYQLAAGRTQFREMSLGDREGARITALTLAITTAVNAVDGDDYTLAIT